MSTVDKDVMLEALSALTGITLKHHTDVRQKATATELHIFNFITIAVTGKGLGAKCSTQYLHEAQAKRTSLDDLDAGSRKELFVNIEEFLDPRFDCDYTNERDHACTRGDEPYKRPCGWYRFGLKVLGKYPDGNAWLGTRGPRSYSVVGEWPVSYHGTSIEGATGITESHYEAGSGQVHGRGIYSTPDIQVASGYSKTFYSSSDGKTYKVLMQNRINPKERKVCKRKDYWLIEVPKETSAEKEKEIVEKSIRPYGILLKEIKK